MLLMAEGVLLSITVFAAAIRPLASGQIGPLGALKFMALASIPMLQYTLPFAACFATTLTYHRLTSDNEEVAMRAGGVSHRSMLAPAFGMGMLLMVGLAILTNETNPRFFHMMERVVKKDAARFIVGPIQRGEAARLDDLLVYADSAIRIDPDDLPDAAERTTSGLKAYDLLVLEGVVVVTTESDGSISADIAAERAEVWLHAGVIDGQDTTVAVIRLRNAVGENQGVGSGEGTFTLAPFEVPRSVSDKPKFYTTRQLRELYREPDINAGVDRRRRLLAAQLVTRLAEEEIRASLENEGRLVLTTEGGDRLIVRAAGVTDAGGALSLDPSPTSGRIDVDWRRADHGSRQQNASEAVLRISTDPQASAAFVSLELGDVKNIDSNEATLSELSWSRMRLANDPAPAVFGADSTSLLGDADVILASLTGDGKPRDLVKARNNLESRIDKLRREIVGQRNERLAYAVACLFITLTGAIMAIRLRDAMPLIVYLWSFFPAVATVVTISGGENVSSRNVGLGIVVIWGGITALASYGATVYLHVRRH